MTTPTTPAQVDLDQLEALAKEAAEQMIPPTDGRLPDWFNEDWLMRDLCDERRDAAFIAAFNPHVAVALIAEVRAHRWIPCSERMPKVGELVLFRGLHWNEPELGRLCAEDDGSPDGWELDDETRYFLSDITHWMPLPSPPKETP